MSTTSVASTEQHEPTAADAYALAPEPVARDTIQQERDLLSAALAHPESLTGDVLDLPAEHFTGERHQQLWSVLADRARRGLPADQHAVFEQFQHIPGMEQYIKQLVLDGIATTGIVPATLAGIISDGHRARTAEKALLAAWQRLAAGNVDGCIEQMTAVDPTEGQLDRSVTLTQAWSEALAESQEGIRIVPTPWRTINRYLNGGWKSREVYFLAGSPGVGKTATGQVIAAHAARKGHQVAVFSLEMARSDLARRTMSTAGKIDMGEVMRPDLDMTGDAWTRTDGVLETIGDTVRINDDIEQTIADVRDQARVYVRRYGTELIVVDYAQLVDVEDKRLDERQAIQQVCKQLKAMAKELGVPVVALAQPNRNAAMQGRKLEMTDLHGSASLEHYGAMVLVMNRVKDVDEDGNQVDSPFVDFGLAKNRYGPLGTVRMLADLSRQNFEET